MTGDFLFLRARSLYEDGLSRGGLARVSDGESFAVFINNPRIETPVQLDLRLIESDQFTSPTMAEAGS
jgi:hypothetical protein